MTDYFASNAPMARELSRAFNEQVAGTTPPAMYPPADPERLHEITPAPWDKAQHKGADL